MSGNINDTNVKSIKTDIYNMISDLEKYSKSSRNISIYENCLQKKYSNLYKTSKSLFNMVFNQYKNKNFDKQYFNTTLNKMLEYISQIQTNQISQYDASVNIGSDLAYKYIPQLKEKLNEKQSSETKIEEINEEN